MSDQPYEVSLDMGDDVQESWIAMYRDRYPERHHIDEIDDEATRGIFHWMNEEDKRETDAHPDPLAEPTSCTEEP
ncbi:MULTISPECIES: hypothetical protein [Nonomuraea]|uniref:Uncharacterized protein n=3 Tax=Nonomuraea TaxID=83681 RepID=A0A7W5VFU4_9ACTN|nr:hypothetical protein [Nonomuraea dietziae]MBB3730735.1 hypothetical protein [Nonomuraea dietziae]